MVETQMQQPILQVSAGKFLSYVSLIDEIICGFFILLFNYSFSCFILLIRYRFYGNGNSIMHQMKTLLYTLKTSIYTFKKFSQ